MIDPIMGEQKEWSELTADQQAQVKTRFGTCDRPGGDPLLEALGKHWDKHVGNYRYKVGSDGNIISRKAK